MRPLRVALLVFLVLAGVSVNRASAQETTDPAENTEQGRFRLGPLRFTPSIALSDLGADSNVFNEQQNPKQDSTAAIGPAVNLWMNLGPARMTGKASGQYLYFSEYESQRAWNTTDDARLELPLARLKPFIGGSYSNTKQRPGFEIDSRAHLRTQSVYLGTTVVLSGKTSLVLTGTRSRLAFDDGETFLGADLASALNRRTDSEELKLRFKLTSLTTLVAGVEAVQDRFALDALRDANSVKVLPGFELRPSALISGTIFVGFRQFDGLSPALPDYQGPIAAVDAKYIAGSTRFGVKVNRDLAYSYEPTQPYYALTDLGLIVTQRISAAWDLIGRTGWQSLAYQQLQSSALASSERTDTIREYGGGVAYRLGQAMRLGFDAIYYQRESSQVALRAFEGLRFGASVSYGLPQ